MIRVSRVAISIIGTIFGLYYAILGAFWIATYQDPSIGVASLFLYIGAMVSSISFYRGRTLPVAQALLNLAVAITVPWLLNPLVAGGTHSTFATWYIGAMGVLLAATAVRGHRVIAWTGAITVFGEVVSWGGLSAIFDSGLIGMVLLVAAGQAISFGLERASREASELAAQALADEAATVATTVQHLERQARAKIALESSLPMLQRIVSAGGNLTPEEKIEARLAEASLRDEIRGRELISDRVREAVRLARIRGIEVVMLDEGGLDEVEPEAKTEILDEVASILDGLSTGKVTVRAPANESWKVTVAAMTPGDNSPALWLKLPR
jgi:hypothetical protein